MALSDEERRRLEKLEQELAATDPDLDSEATGLTLAEPGNPPRYLRLLAVLAASWFLSGLSHQTVSGQQPERRTDGGPWP
jgi:hypothetical protein